MQKKTILVAPLHWGLGHATRCIPIIQELLNANFNVLLGSDGEALLLLQKEFPSLPFVKLPSYNISYPKRGNLFKLSMLLQLPAFYKTNSLEKKLVQKLVSENRIDGIISDNRFGIRSDKVPSVFITHQLNVLSGATTYFSGKIHQTVIKKFDECWVPDVIGSPSLSGRLGHLKSNNFNVKYIGPISRFKKRKHPIKYDILALISGPEPQRSMFENKLVETLKNSNNKILLVRGVVESRQHTEQVGGISIVNYMNSPELEAAINESEYVISRSGYTTIMDLSKLEKKALLIPTPGQYEQQYLAKRLKNLGLAASCEQHQFTSKKLKEIIGCSGLEAIENTQSFESLFSLFESK